MQVPDGLARSGGGGGMLGLKPGIRFTRSGVFEGGGRGGGGGGGSTWKAERSEEEEALL